MFSRIYVFWILLFFSVIWVDFVLLILNEAWTQALSKTSLDHSWKRRALLQLFLSTPRRKSAYKISVNLILTIERQVSHKKSEAGRGIFRQTQKWQIICHQKFCSSLRPRMVRDKFCVFCIFVIIFNRVFTNFYFFWIFCFCSAWLRFHEKNYKNLKL